MVQLRRRKSARNKNREEQQPRRRREPVLPPDPEPRRPRRRNVQQQEPEEEVQNEPEIEINNYEPEQEVQGPVQGPQNLHPLVYNFINYRKNRPRPHYQPGQGIFCGSPQNLPQGRELGTNYKCLRKGFGASSSAFIRDLDAFIREQPNLN